MKNKLTLIAIVLLALALCFCSCYPVGNEGHYGCPVTKHTVGYH